MRLGETWAVCHGAGWAAGSSRGVAMVCGSEGVILPLGEGGREERFWGGGRLRDRQDLQKALPAVGAASGRERRVKQGWKWGDGAEAAAAAAASLTCFTDQAITTVNDHHQMLFLPGQRKVINIH